MKDEQQGSPVYDPAEAARRLDLSGAGLRRLVLIYERVFGELPRDSRGGRLWTEEAIDRLSRARAMVQNGRSPSVEAALVAEQSGEEVDFSPVPRSTSERLSATFLEEIQKLRKAVELQNTILAKQVADQGQRLDALEAAPKATELPETDAGDDSRGDALDDQEKPAERVSWLRRIFGGS